MTPVEIINLTPHEVVICDKNHVPQLVIPASGLMIRCTPSTEVEDIVHLPGSDFKIPLTLTTYTRPDIPPAREGLIYIVSELVAKMFPERSDLRIINGKIRTGGKVIGCRSLGRIP